MYKAILVILLFFAVNAGAQPREEIKKRIDSLEQFMRGKNTEAFALATVYRGNEAKRKWKDANNPENADELRAARQLLEQLKKAFSECNYREFDVFGEKKESEGTWYVYTYACGKTRKIHLAFLKIKGKYLLGDIDVHEDNDEE